ncbi:MAG: hypothetical protein R6W95_02790 [Desulfosarcina sp.]
MKKKGIALKPVLMVIVALLISIPGLWLAISRFECQHARVRALFP